MLVEALRYAASLVRISSRCLAIEKLGLATVPDAAYSVPLDLEFYSTEVVMLCLDLVFNLDRNPSFAYSTLCRVEHVEPPSSLLMPAQNEY